MAEFKSILIPTDFSPCADYAVNYAAAQGCDLIVTGTHGHTGFNRFLFGSTCERLVRRSPIPVLAVKQSGADATFIDGPIVIDRILCTTDLSDWSKAALPYAAGLCRALGARLLLQHVIDTRFDTFPHLAAVDQPDQQQMHKQAERILREMVSDYADLQAETSVLDGVPHSRIDETIIGHNIDLLVMATHGRRGIAHALLGSTAEKVVRLARCPVLTVRPG